VEKCGFCNGNVIEKKLTVDFHYKCDFCKTGIVKTIKSLEKLYYKGSVYIFENVPVGVCNNCGERYIHAKVLSKMEKKC